MTDRVFADTNIVIYAESNNPGKTEKAVSIVAETPVISSQVINECVSTLMRKYRFLQSEAHEIALSLMAACEVAPVNADTIKAAIQLCQRYSFSHWDSLIVAAALQAKCTILYSEDMQHGQVIDDRLTIINPFVATTL